VVHCHVPAFCVLVACICKSEITMKLHSDMRYSGPQHKGRGLINLIEGSDNVFRERTTTGLLNEAK